LSKLGVSAVCLEKDEISSGATWHAAGLVTHFHGGNNFRLWHKETLDTLKEWGAHSFHTPGSIRLIEKGNRDRLDEAYHHAGKSELYAKLFGCQPMNLVSADEIKKLHPLTNVDDIECGLYTTGDGHVDPSSVTNLLLERAKPLGGFVKTHAEVQDCKQDAGNDEWVVKVQQPGAEELRVVRAKHVVNCAGLWCKAVGEMSGVSVPAVVLQHQYVITEEIPELKELHKERGGQLPVLRDLKGSYYLRDEGQGILIGPYEERESVVVPPGSVPGENTFFLYDGDADRLMPHLERAMEVVPVTGETGIKTILCGPTCWPADGNHLVGPSHEKKNYWLACAESYGIAHSVGLGRYMAHYIAHGEPPYELNETDPSRFGDWAHDAFVRDKVTEVYGWNNHVHYPNENAPAARPVRQDGTNILPCEKLYESLKKRGCQFSIAGGWEAPNWFLPKEEWNHGEPVQYGNDFGSYRRPEYCKHVQRECQDLLNNCSVLFWPFAKYEISGKDADAVLSASVGNDLPEGDRVQLNHLLTPSGKVFSEVTMLKLGENHYYAVSYPAMEKFDKYWLEVKNSGKDFKVKSVSNDRCVFMVNGPNSKSILSSKVDGAFAEPWKLFRFKAFSFDKDPELQELLEETGEKPYALKVSFIGELGWELHVPTKIANRLYQKLTDDWGVGDWGGAAMNSFRLEKGIPLFGKDFTKDHSATEVGLAGRFVKPEKGEFTGKKAIEYELTTGNRFPHEGETESPGKLRKLVSYHLEGNGEVDTVGNEPIFDTASGQCVGFTTSGAPGWMCGKTVGMGYVYEGAGMDLEVQLLDKRVKLVVDEKPLVETWGQRQRAAKESGERRSASAASPGFPAQQQQQLRLFSTRHGGQN
jgi:dimethylglycine dehydrogenase